MSDLQDNERGILSKSQRQFLLRNYLTWFTLYLLLGGAITALFFQGGWLWGMGMLAVYLYALIGITYVHCSDLWLKPIPKRTVGMVDMKVLRSPTTYGLLKINRIELKSEPKLWKGLKTGQSYEIFYAPKSKWLLSYRSVDNSSTSTL